MSSKKMLATGFSVLVFQVQTSLVTHGDETIFLQRQHDPDPTRVRWCNCDYRLWAGMHCAGVKCTGAHICFKCAYVYTTNRNTLRKHRGQPLRNDQATRYQRVKERSSDTATRQRDFQTRREDVHPTELSGQSKLDHGAMPTLVYYKTNFGSRVHSGVAALVNGR